LELSGRLSESCNGRRMRKKLFIGTTLFLAAAFTAAAADLSGKWVAQIEGRNGTSQMTFDLKADGAQLTGTVTGGGGGRGGRRGGAGGAGGAAAAPAPAAIADGKIDGNKVTFSVKVDRNGQTNVTTYTGTWSGDELNLKQTRTGRNGEQTTDIKAKRSTS
jgi:hypothetical protein